MLRRNIFQNYTIIYSAKFLTIQFKPKDSVMNSKKYFLERKQNKQKLNESVEVVDVCFSR